ncbi:MAG: SusD/RagB family nutrient-binding outer membrane lipoprotein, partial [Flavobacteriaceae bacterium]
TSSDSWPTNTKFDTDPQGSYFRIKMAATLVEAMQVLDDPRLGVWANKVDQPLVLDSSDFVDETTGERHVSQASVDAYVNTVGFPVNYDKEYVGLPTAMTFGAAYNMSENVNQGTLNLHVSQLNDIYKEASGDLLQARLISAAEVNFIIAEAATNGWASGSAEQYYNEAIKQSFSAWGVEDGYDDYIAGTAAYGGYEDIITQKWIASWSSASEAWFDYRRTGLPALQTGAASKRAALPLRFYYHINEIDNNSNSAEAIERLEPTQFKGDDVSNNSAWSKMWLLQGTTKPY